MRGPSLQRTAALSAALHVTVFILSALILKQSHHTVLPSPYIVSIVGQEAVSRESGHERASSTQESVKAAVPPENSVPKNEKVSKSEEKRLEEVIAAMEAKKKLERIARLKSAMVSIRGNEGSGKKDSLKPMASGSKGVTGSASYEDKIRVEIHDKWRWPDTVKKNLETIIVVTIKRDGTISLQNIVWEKKSGNRLFDKSVVDAVRDASPVTPPPHEMEIGIRFYL